MNEARCEYEVSIPDEYGMACSEPELGVPTTLEFRCNSHETTSVTVHDEYVQWWIEEAGGWDTFRESVKALGGDDPGPDPGHARWGDVTIHLCEEHMAELHDDMAHGRLTGMTIVDDDDPGDSPERRWNDTWEDNMNTSSHIGFSVFEE